MKKTFRPSFISYSSSLKLLILMVVISTILLNAQDVIGGRPLKLPSIFLPILSFTLVLSPIVLLYRLIIVLGNAVIIHDKKLSVFENFRMKRELSLAAIQKARVEKYQQPTAPIGQPISSSETPYLYRFVFITRNDYHDECVLEDWDEKRVKEVISYLKLHFPHMQFEYDFTTPFKLTLKLW